MSLTFNSGPNVTTGQSPSLNGYTSDYNGDLGPDMAWGGMGFLDPRFGVNQQAQPGEPAVLGYAGGTIVALDAIPTASAVNNIAASAVPVAGTPMTLVSTTTSVVNTLSTALFAYPARTTIPSGTLVLDTSPGKLAVAGTSSSVQLYQPASNLARAVKVVSAGNDASASFTVSGYDIYGYAMTEKITGGSGATAAGKKAFKFVSSVIPAGTVSGSNVSIGTTDVIGFALKSPRFTDLLIFYNSALITATTGFVGADLTSTATSTTGDVRGTYALQTAADGVKRINVQSFVSPGQVIGGSVGLFGVTQA